MQMCLIILKNVFKCSCAFIQIILFIWRYQNFGNTALIHTILLKVVTEICEKESVICRESYSNCNARGRGKMERKGRSLHNYRLARRHLGNRALRGKVERARTTRIYFVACSSPATSPAAFITPIIGAYIIHYVQDLRLQRDYPYLGTGPPTFMYLTVYKQWGKNNFHFTDEETEAPSLHVTLLIHGISSA